jgi:D-alanine-D-alanine ligase
MVNKLNIAVVAGGYSGESVISLKSAKMVIDHIDRERFSPTLIVLDRQGFHAHVDSDVLPMDLNTFTYTKAGVTTSFDAAFIIIHGTPGEDGKLQGYFDLIGMTYTTGDVCNMAMTFNKALTNNFLKQCGYKTGKNVLIKAHDHYSTTDIVSQLGLPVFVKPNNGGSSIATTKVAVKEALHAAIDLALTVDPEVIIESFLQGTEVSCGVIEWEGKVTALPVTEIVSHTDFFDYQAKYEGKSEEITPARISDEMTRYVQKISCELYTLTNCKGMMRTDFIIQRDQPYIIEINTVPGFSPASIIPQQAAARGIDKTQLISAILDSVL